MRSPTRCAHTRAALAVASLILLLAGCGGGGSDSKSTSASPTGTSANPGTTTAPATIPDTPASPTSETPTPVAASTATLQWSAPQAMTDGSTTVTGIVGYRVYYGPSVTKMDTKIDVMNPSISTYVVEGLTSGTYYFAITALHSSGGESDRSNAGMKVIG
jgi:hypothetical protein